MPKAEFSWSGIRKALDAAGKKWSSCIRTLLPNRVLFIVWGSINGLLFAGIYYNIHQRDSAWYTTSFALSVFALLLWTHTQSMQEFRIPVYVRHLICLLLPYSILLADLLNSQWKNKAYFLSQVFVYFTLGTIFLSLDVLLRDSGFNKGTFRKILVALWGAVCSLLLVLFLLLSINTLLGNVSLDYDAVIAICQTDVAEAAGYFSRLNHRYLLLFLFCVTIPGLAALNLLAFRLPHRCGRQEVQCRLTGLLLAVLFLVAAEAGFHKKLYFSNIFKLMASPVSYFQENRRFQELRCNYTAFIREKFREEPKNPHASGIFVIIIGESLNRHYMSAYGYPTDTTPFQRKLAAGRQVTLFQRPYSAYAQTIRCIAYMLTDQNQYDNRDKTLQNSVSLFDIARYNGFTTRWFSAQGTPLLLDSPTAVLAESAEYSFSLPAVRSKIGHKATDMDLLEFLPRQLNDKEFIVIQLLGSHYPYGNVYPAGFMAESSLSDYEKSVCYNPPRKGCDEQLIQTVSEMAPRRIVYVSCDPATLSRDLKRFTEVGYTPKEVTPVDLFPRTAHVENVCLLEQIG